MIIAFCWLYANEFISVPGRSIIGITGVYAYCGCTGVPKNKNSFHSDYCISFVLYASSRNIVAIG